MQASAYPASATVGVGPRLLAAIIDGVGLGIIYFIVMAVTNTALAATVLAILSIVYFPYMEKTRGATFGKQLLGLKVVQENGAPLTWSNAILRFVLRIIDGLFAGLVAAILIWTSPMHQRLGDRLGHTLVVRKDALPGSPVPAQQF
jgi:uncharacterized RDD family membrane protein YckC